MTGFSAITELTAADILLWELHFLQLAVPMGLNYSQKDRHTPCGAVHSGSNHVVKPSSPFPTNG